MRIVLGLVLLGGMEPVRADEPDVPGWTRVPKPRVAGTSHPAHGSGDADGWFRLDCARAEAVLNRAPQEIGRGRIGRGVRWELPMPDGELRSFLIVESPVMAPELARKYPRLKTYRGVGVDDPRQLLRLDLNQGHLHAQVLGPGGAVYIDPEQATPSTYRSYYAPVAAQGAEAPFECETVADRQETAEAASTGGAVQPDGKLRVYRLAIAATAEYTQFHGGTVESGLGAIVSAVNRLNGIFESELAIRFELVAGNDLLVFTDPATDPYDNTDATAMLLQNQWAIDSRIGSANYDVGHVFATGGGGLAQLDSVCVAGWKARGVTGRELPIGDAFCVDYVAHELGHQFGARHSFNGVTGSCSEANRHPETAYEPGSGSTIMSYSGNCGSDNLQYLSDPYFHSANLLEIYNFIYGTSVAAASTGNGVPVVSAGSDQFIPAGTAFELTASGSDPDGDSLTYCWEQIDLGPAVPLDGMDHGAGPLFRSFPPEAQPVRVFPSLARMIQNTPSLAEVLPTTARTLNFRVTARDNREGGGAFAMDEVQLTVVTNAGPFRIVSPNGADELSGAQEIQWDVAGTDQAPVSSPCVDIVLSTNGGFDYPIVLAQGALNDGSETVIFPELYSASARIQVRAANNVFFDISDSDFAIVPSSQSSLLVRTETTVLSNETGLLLPASGTMGNASTFPSQIEVSNLLGVVESVEVYLSGLTHTALDDLDVLLVGPSGQGILLLSDAGGGGAAAGVDLVFSDDGQEMPAGVSLPSGTYRPVNVGSAGDSFPVPGPYGSTLAAFQGMNPNGSWSLYIIDDTIGDVGSLAGGWALSLTTSRVEAQVPAAPAITSLRVRNDMAWLSWTAVPGTTYRVECAEDLQAPVWLEVGEAVVSDGPTATMSCPVQSPGQRFFRVRAAP